ncbi:MAG: class I SAM-dependent methyltransferase [Bacteroidota bacterium]
MIIKSKRKIEATIDELYLDAKNDYLQMIKGATKSILRPSQPSDFKNAYLAISKEQGKELVDLICKNNIKNIVEFGTSFGISTLFLAQGAIETGGTIITTELIESKAHQAIENFEKAGVHDIIELRIGDALETLNHHNEHIDLLLLDGWKNLYLPLFQLLEPNFHAKTIIYVDNADMAESRLFLDTVRQNSNYRIQYNHQGKAALITLN